MTDEFDTQVGAWLRERARPDPRALATVRGTIDSLPDRDRGGARAWWRQVAAVLAVSLIAVGAFAVLLAPRPSGTTPSRPVPPDPAAFAGDPRLSACFADAGPVEFAFEMPHARDYQRHLPKMLLAPELDVDDAAFVVVFEKGAQLQLPITGPPTASSSPTDAATATGDPRTVCIVVADTPNVYENVDITGMRVEVGDVPPTMSPTSATTPSPAAIRPTTPPSDPPAPSWTANLTGQLECNGKPSTTGGEVGHVPFESGSADSPAAAMVAFLRDTFHTDIPTGGYELTNLEGHYARFAYATNGKVKAVVILSDEGPDHEPGVWTPTGLRACNPAEFGPDAASNQLPIWLDENGTRVPTSTVLETKGPEHCGWESTTWLRYAGRLYVRDPRGVLADHTVGSFDGDATLPAGATSTGYHEGGRTIWRTPNRDSILVVLADHVERWPAASPDLGCA